MNTEQVHFYPSEILSSSDKAQKRKWHEEKLIAKLEKEAAKKEEEEMKKKVKIEEADRVKTQGQC